jgi:hypothetical protein
MSGLNWAVIRKLPILLCQQGSGCLLVHTSQNNPPLVADCGGLLLLLLLQVLDYAPDVLLLSPCSRSPAAAMPDVQLLTQQPGFADLAAVKAGQTYVIDHAWFSRPGPRLWDGIELLAALLYGECSHCDSSSSSSRDDGSSVAGGSMVGAQQQQQQQQQNEAASVLKLLSVGADGAVSWAPLNLELQ